MESGRLKEAGEQRYEGGADEGDTAASHELLHALGLGTGVIVAVAFEQVYDTPNAETGTERDNEGLENTNCRRKKCHIQMLLKVRMCIGVKSRTDHRYSSFSSPFKNFLIWFDF